MNLDEAAQLVLDDPVMWDVEDDRGPRRGTITCTLADGMGSAVQARVDDEDRIVWVHYSRLRVPGPTPAEVETAAVEAVSRARYLIEFPGPAPTPWAWLSEADREWHRRRTRWYVEALERERTGIDAQ